MSDHVRDTRDSEGAMGILQRLRSRVRDDPLRSRLGRRLLGWFLLFSLMPLLGSNMLGYLESQGIIEGLIEHQLSAIAEAEAQHVRDQVDGLLHNLHMVAAGNRFLAAGAVQMGGGDGGEMGAVASRPVVEDYLARKLAELQEFEVLYLQRPDGSIAAATGPVDHDVGILRSVPGESAGIESLEGPIRNGDPRFRLSVPLESEEGRLVGYLGALMGPEGLGDLLEIPPHVAGAIESFILDERGRPLFISHVHGHVDYGAPLATPLLEGEPRRFMRYPDREGVEVIGTGVPVAGLPWRYVAEFPVSAALGPLRFLRRLSILVGTAFAGLLVVTAWFVAGGIVAPVRRLVDAARRVGKGDLSVRVPSGERDEIGELGRTFNEMTEELASTRARVEELHHREIERAQQLATVGELASGVAHEIKNPVVGISNGLDLVKRRLGEDEELTPIMDEMGRQLSRMEVAVRDLLAFARPPEPSLVSADGNALVQRALTLVAPAAERARVRVEFDPAPELPPLRVDPELIRQALVNLAMNAIQATPAEGRVRLETVRRPDGEVEIRVEDTGKGIPEERVDEIFRPFFTTRHSGTGLGLSITREVVEGHGGRVEVESAVGRGSRFTMVLPAADPDASSTALDPETRPARENSADGGES